MAERYGISDLDGFEPKSLRGIYGGPHPAFDISHKNGAVYDSTENDEILGFTGVGAIAGELMAAVQTVMLAKRPYTVLRDAILAHPTTVEGLTVFFSAVPAPIDRQC